jgi:hypothetical protein
MLQAVLTEESFAGGPLTDEESAIGRNRDGSMKENGPTTNATARVHADNWKLEAKFTLETGRMISGTERARSDLLVVQSMLGSSKRTSCMERESIPLPMEVCMKAISRMICDRDMATWRMPMDSSMSESGETIGGMEKELSFIPIVVSLKESFEGTIQMALVTSICPMGLSVKKSGSMAF